MATTSETQTRVAPALCNPDQPPARYADYPPNFDMVDLPEHLDYWPHLRQHLEQCAAVLWDPYQMADGAALYEQKRHRALTLLAAVFGTLAVVLAIIQLAVPTHTPNAGASTLTILEVMYALAAAATVISIVYAVKFRWQLKRHQAERMRQLKFGFLIDPESWCGEDAFKRQVAKLDADKRAVLAMTPTQFRAWAEELDLPDRPHELAAHTLDAETIEQLVEYYRAKRVVFERLYFHDRTQRNDAKDWLTGRLAPILFFGSVACVIVHFILDRFPTGSRLDELAHLFIAFAVALPAIGAGVRFYCAAHEFARNKVRYRAKEVGLRHLDKVLKRPSGADERIRDMEFCEHILSLEHREWSRLMIETEVFP